jgi:iron(II)-dependent oxidoreductase
VTSAELLAGLRMAQELLTALVEDLDEATWRWQYHPDLDAAGWYLGHCVWTECHWLQEVATGDDRFTAPVAGLYAPADTTKPQRGDQLPPRDALLQWAGSMQSLNQETLEDSTSAIHRHPLMADNYLLHFLIQYYSRHFEILIMVLTQRALQQDNGDFTVSQPLAAARDTAATQVISPGHYRVGGQRPTACDNELPPQQATLGPYRIVSRPVSNSNYLAFMEDGGYDNPSLWSEDGAAWRDRHGTHAPEHWRRDVNGHWYGIGNRGAYELTGSDVLQGISWHEAQAYARWAGGRLPHEHQWEVACRLRCLEQSGRAWEWCDNSFYPYHGFQAFPAEAFSTPGFDGKHYTLRGGSLHTRPSIRRASYRNFHRPEKRHIFAGLRLVYET